MRENTKISERILQIIEYYGINKNRLAKALGYERAQAIYDVVNEKAQPSFDFFNKFAKSEFSESVNIEWLISGEGEMLKSQSSPTGESSSDWKNLSKSQQRQLENQAETINRMSMLVEKLQKELDEYRSQRGNMGKGKIVSKMNSVA